MSVPAPNKSEIAVPSLDILAPVLMCCALLWWVSRGMSWSTRLAVAAITLALIVAVVVVERSGIRPDQFRN